MPQTWTVDGATWDYASLAALPDPVECARLITLIARDRGNLPPDLAALRAVRLIEARKRDGRQATWLAQQVGLERPSAIARLTAAAFGGRRTKRATAQTTQTDGGPQ